MIFSCYWLRALDSNGKSLLSSLLTIGFRALTEMAAIHQTYATDSNLRIIGTRNVGPPTTLLMKRTVVTAGTDPVIAVKGMTNIKQDL